MNLSFGLNPCMVYLKQNKPIKSDILAVFEMLIFIGSGNPSKYMINSCDFLLKFV